MDFNSHPFVLLVIYACGLHFCSGCLAHTTLHIILEPLDMPDSESIGRLLLTRSTRQSDKDRILLDDFFDLSPLFSCFKD